MKIYQTSITPNARRVRIFLAEKNIPMEYTEVDIMGGENLSNEFRQKNPTTKIPVLELDDGSHISESVAICRYFEETHPQPPLMGSNPKEKALVEMWQRRVELYFFFQIGMSFQHTSGVFKDRMTPIKEWGEVAGTQAQEFIGILNSQLEKSTYIAGENFSIADITCLCAVDFARVINLHPSEEDTHLQRWYKLVSSRPSATA